MFWSNKYSYLSGKQHNKAKFVAHAANTYAELYWGGCAGEGTLSLILDMQLSNTDCCSI